MQCCVNVCVQLVCMQNGVSTNAACVFQFCRRTGICAALVYLCARLYQHRSTNTCVRLYMHSCAHTHTYVHAPHSYVHTATRTHASAHTCMCTQQYVHRTRSTLYERKGAVELASRATHMIYYTIPVLYIYIYIGQRCFNMSTR